MVCCDRISHAEQISRISPRPTWTRSLYVSINVHGRPRDSKLLPIDYEWCSSDQLNPPPESGHSIDAPGHLTPANRYGSGRLKDPGSRRGRRQRQGIDRVKESRFMSHLDRLRISDDSAIRDALSWYLDVAENRRPAKFRIAATIAAQVDPASSSEGALWAELDRLTPIFVTRWQAIRAGASLPQAAEGPSLLELCRELAYRMLAHCNFCPWNCQVDRVTGAKFGACKLASGSRVSSHFHHTGEELFYRGTQGSGTIFFTSCNMRCAFCQNGDISTDKDNGEE